MRGPDHHQPRPELLDGGLDRLRRRTVTDGPRLHTPMSRPSGPSEIRYRGDARRIANKLLFAAAVLLAASFLTGAWGIASLLHASWLDTNDLPVGDNVFWGVVMLVLATIQGVSALLILFDRPSGRYLGILAAVIGLWSHVGAQRS
jgi:hypothetical protein